MMYKYVPIFMCSMRILLLSHTPTYTSLPHQYYFQSYSLSIYIVPLRVFLISLT